jgi:hypothetical protein
MNKILVKLLMVSLLSSVQASVHQPLWYESPAKSWMKEYLPLGNGSQGGTVSGGLNKEYIQFNEGTLWVGSEGDAGTYQAFGDLYLDLRHDKAKKIPPGTGYQPHGAPPACIARSLSQGKVTSMKARGGFVVDMEWKAGKLTELKIGSLQGAPLKLRNGDKGNDVKLKKGKTKTV